MHYFYVTDIIQGVFTLPEEEARHCIKTLRHKKGDIIYVTNGNGQLCVAQILNDRYQECTLETIEIIEKKSRPFRLHIAVSLLKSPDRFEWFVEKATELGVDEITPIICEKTEKGKIRMERLHKIALSASKQSLRINFPQINEVHKFTDFVNIIQPHKSMIAWCGEYEKKNITEVYIKGENALILIGPEGDFTEKEVDLANNFGFDTITLGNQRLRTETAAIHACSVVNTINF
jgi:16S rRNA (uracil1498-N3)-methyltransferase